MSVEAGGVTYVIEHVPKSEMSERGREGGRVN